MTLPPLILITFIFQLISPSPLLAQPNTQGLTIIPPRFELQANPGDNLSETIKLRNDTDLPVSYEVIVEDFTSSGEEGGVYLEEGESDQAFSLAQWLTPAVDEIVLQPRQEQTFRYTITVPKAAEPGGHYASVLFVTTPEVAQPGAANVATRIGALVLLRISGNVTETAKIETFSAPAYLKSGPVPLTLRVQNQGNVHVQPKGTIIITDLFGRKVDEVPLRNANVLPSAIRKTETTWDKVNLLGRYTATLVATYGQQNLPLTAATRFTVASPTAVILLVVAGLALLFFVISLFSGRSRLRQALKTFVTGK
ncbi:hypothetical protein A2W24_04870 [Microgenomates group bacterium RBG_16_45_19]|nr:MAG: hypothetical protein A2W24_04870 [Microgenomates group bacterium RBG_16_45_19]